MTRGGPPTTDDATRTRRGFLAALGAAGTGAVAGCTIGPSGGPTGPYGGWASGANGFAGIDDRTGEGRVTVAVGAGDGYAFDPVAVRVSPGTTVVWEWTGRGGRHNVDEDGDAYRSPYYSTAGKTFSHAFEATGVSKYYCQPHRNMGMKGVVDVVEG